MVRDGARARWRRCGWPAREKLRWPPYARRASSSGWRPSRPWRNFHPRLGTALHGGVVCLRARAVVPVRLGRRGYRRWQLNVDRGFLHDDRRSVVVRRRVVPPIWIRIPPERRPHTDEDVVPAAKVVMVVVPTMMAPTSAPGVTQRHHSEEKRDSEKCDGSEPSHTHLQRPYVGKGGSHARRSDTPEDLPNEGPRQVALGRDRRVVDQFGNQMRPVRSPLSSRSWRPGSHAPARCVSPGRCSRVVAVASLDYMPPFAWSASHLAALAHAAAS
jgi:hypothetical protein